MASQTPIQLFAIHGNGGGAARFASLHPHMPADVELVAEDLPGFGAAADRGALDSVAAYGEHLLERIRRLPRPRVVLGHGIGGSLALEMLQRAADAGGGLDVLDGLVLHAPVGARLDTRKLPWVMRREWIRGLARRVLAFRPLRPMWRRKLFTAPLPGDIERAFFDGYRHCPGFGPMFEWLTADWFAGLQPADVPAVLLWGMEEKVLDASQAEAFGPILPRARVELVEGWGHFPMLERPADYAQRIAVLARELAGRGAEARVEGVAS